MSIWRYSKIAENILTKNQLSREEGNTPIEKYMFNGKEILLKREDKNPNQSFKDRSLCFQVAVLVEKGIKKFVISSSGNAARSAISYCKLHGISLSVFVSEQIPDYKYSVLLKSAQDSSLIEIKKSKRPKSDAIKFSRDCNAYNLRGSRDDNAVVGFKSISYELIDQAPETDAIFICCSSGTSTLGIYEGYAELVGDKYELLSNKEQFPSKKYKFPNFHIVQTTKICPIAKEFDGSYIPSETSIANAISDRTAYRKNKILEIVKETNGYGWVVSDAEIIHAKDKLSTLGVQVEGYNAYVSFAGYLKAISQSSKFDKPVILISGI